MLLRCRATVSLAVAQLPSRRAGSNSRQGRLSQCTQQRSMQPHLQMRAVVLRAARVRVAHEGAVLSPLPCHRDSHIVSRPALGRLVDAPTPRAPLCVAH